MVYDRRPAVLILVNGRRTTTVGAANIEINWKFPGLGKNDAKKEPPLPAAQSR
jgi:hypothetical protein